MLLVQELSQKMSRQFDKARPDGFVHPGADIGHDLPDLLRRHDFFQQPLHMFRGPSQSAVKSHLDYEFVRNAFKHGLRDGAKVGG